MLCEYGADSLGSAKNGHSFRSYDRRLIWKPGQVNLHVIQCGKDIFFMSLSLAITQMFLCLNNC
ncbi:protein of unknown function [Denitratisoma oestradiolicum]|uniref:Uncharacterized protein n=1 Tax=Denitratisoma oestradiolicum TaxID=311182 RepID=A0A6S6Y262_9PROT|nr:hypothetical protein CBW56_16415 [Denitratisoma oestradiolicum]CAB1371031.1 protein of unknown function [Denitratisoma oestradiolicum]